MPITDHNIAQNERNTCISSQHISKIDKFGSKYSLHKIAHVQIRDMHTNSSEGVLKQTVFDFPKSQKIGSVLSRIQISNTLVGLLLACGKAFYCCARAVQ